MKCLIISGGQLEKDYLIDVVNRIDDAYIIAADRGALLASEAGIRVDKAIGDFDSVSDDDRKMIFEKYDVEVLIPEKDDTDTEHALRYAISLEPEEIIMLGCTGSRLDQTLASIRMLKLACEKGIPAYVQDRNNRIRVAKGKTELNKSKAFGNYLSIVPYGDKAEGVTLKGLKYSVENYTMTADNSLGISNELASDEAEILCDDYLIIMETID